MMLHQDGSRHEWLAGQAACDLIVTMDDATSEIYSAFLVEEEGTASTFRALKQVFTGKGLPSSPLHRPRQPLLPHPRGRRQGRQGSAHPGRPRPPSARHRAHRCLFARGPRPLRARLRHPPGPPRQPVLATGVRRRRQPGAVPGGGRAPRCIDREAGGTAAGAVGTGPDRAPFRARGRRRGHGPVAPGAEDRRCARRAPALRSRPASANLAETAAFMDAQKRILVFSMAGGTGRSYHADLSCANTDAGSTTCWSRAGGQTRRSRASGGPPDAPGLGAAVPARHHRCEGRAALHRHHCQAARQPRRHHPRTARFPDRHGRQRPGALSRERQPGEKPLRQDGAQAFLHRALARQHPGLVARPFRGRHRPQAGPRRQPQGGSAADDAFPEPAAGAADRRAEPALRRTGRADPRQHRAGHGGRRPTRSGSRPCAPTRSPSPAGRRSTSIPAPGRSPSW